MPAVLERKLKKEYGENSDVPYKIMNKLGYMRGNKENKKVKIKKKDYKADAKAKMAKYFSK